MRFSSQRSRLGVDHARRGVLRTAALCSCLAVLGYGGGVSALPPKETGLSDEGLLEGQPGFQPRSPASLPVAEIPGFLSKPQLERCYAAYREDFTKLLQAETGLQSAPRDAGHAADYAALRAQQLVAANSVLLHELYFRNLAVSRVRPSRYVLENMSEHMGTLESWRDDFIACARAAASWAVLAYDPYDDRWHNLALGAMDAGGMIGNNPLVVCDVSEEAWSLDYRDVEDYVSRFIEHVDWNVVGARYRAVDRH